MERLAVVSLLVTRLAFSQTFDVASVKPAHPPAGITRFTMSGGPGTDDPGRISYTNIMLKRVLLSAYRVRPWQVSGPDWLDSLRFDITARVPEGATQEQFQTMLRNLLVDRFRMAVHKETREVPIYALVVGKNGPKLKSPGGSAGAAPDQDEQLAIVKRPEGGDGFPALALGESGLVIETRNGRGRVTARRTPLWKFADLLSSHLGRPVIDKTGLPGSYDFVLYFAPEGMNPDTATDPGIFSALQEQLGLRLEGGKGPIEMVVVDRAQAVPTEN